jgi:hypothetical protein
MPVLYLPLFPRSEGEVNEMPVPSLGDKRKVGVLY